MIKYVYESFILFNIDYYMTTEMKVTRHFSPKNPEDQLHMPNISNQFRTNEAKVIINQM